MNKCPICGGEIGYFNSYDLEYPFAYGCNDCYLSTYGYTEESAKALWDEITERMIKHGNCEEM